MPWGCPSEQYTWSALHGPFAIASLARQFTVHFSPTGTDLLELSLPDSLAALPVHERAALLVTPAIFSSKPLQRSLLATFVPLVSETLHVVVSERCYTPSRLLQD